jgi:hypothetical protein
MAKTTTSGNHFLLALFGLILAGLVYWRRWR